MTVEICYKACISFRLSYYQYFSTKLILQCQRLQYLVAFNYTIEIY